MKAQIDFKNSTHELFHKKAPRGHGRWTFLVYTLTGEKTSETIEKVGMYSECKKLVLSEIKNKSVYDNTIVQVSVM